MARERKLAGYEAQTTSRRYIFDFPLKKRGPVSELRDDVALDPRTYPAWGADTITRFSQQFFNNVVRTQINLEPISQRCKNLDLRVSKFLDECQHNEYPVPFMLMVRAHSAWRAAYILSSAGQHFESMAAIRQSLECLGYGMMILESVDSRNIWRDRKKDHKKVSKHFTSARMEAAMPKAINVARLWRHLYDKTISLGAHPNEEGVWANAPIQHFHEDIFFANIVYFSSDYNSFARMFRFLISNIRIMLYCLHKIDPVLFVATSGSGGLDPIRRVDFI